MADPVSIIVTPIVDVIISNVASLLKEEFLAIKGVKKAVEKLSSNLTSIRAVLEDAEKKQLDESSQSLRDWLTKLKYAACDAEDILDIFATETFLWKRKPQVYKLNICYKSSVAHRIKEISSKLDVIDEEKNRFHLNTSSDGGRPPNLPQTTFFVDKRDVFGRDSDKKRLKDQMLSNESDAEGDVSVIPIVGMGGLGKTTLAQLFFNDERVKKHFEFKIWVCVTLDFNVRRILKDMIEFQTKINIGNLNPNILVSRFLDVFAGKKFLLVLDDIVCIKDYLEWKPLLDLLKEGGKGSRVLVTTRSNKVSHIVGTEPAPYELESLPEAECWSLFKKFAFKDRGTHEKLEDIGREIVGKCKGLPLAVRAMGGLLRGNDDEDKWKKILGHNISELEEGNFNRPNILPVLKLSYDHLPSNLKQCFAYCSLFSKAYVFDRKELVKLWMAQGFIQSSSGQSLEQAGIECFEELLTRSFFQTFNIDDKVRYRMHDLIHELAVSVSTPECCRVTDNKSCSFDEKTRHVSLLCQDLENPTMQLIDRSNKLRTLLLPTEYLKSFGQTPDKMFQALEKMFRFLKYIRVLDLSSSSLLELPSSIEEVKLLRYLDLSRTEIKVLPNSICKLCNLQTLKLLGCLWLFELPKDLGNMVNLHYLELDDMFWFKCRKLPPRMGNLNSLQNLHAFRVSGTSRHGIEELKNMANLTGTLHILNLENAVNAAEAKLNEKESLQKLVLEWSGQDFNQEDEARANKGLEDFKPHSNLKELALYHFKGSNFPSWMTDGVLKNMVRLTLSHCTKCTSVLSVSQSPRLRELYIKGMPELEEWPDVGCPSLGTLHISYCPQLRKVPDLMPYLKDLKIKKCDSLKALPMTPSLETLILSDNLVLEDWNEGLCTFEDDQGQVGETRPTLLGLLEMKVENCPNIQELPQKILPEKLEISGCEHITALPAPQFLKHLALKSCSNGTLVRAIPSTNSLYSLVISNITNLTSFPKFPHLPRLECLYISDCDDLTSISEEQGSLKSLSSLKLLSIRGCRRLESLPDEGLPTALECLIISSCPILVSLGANETLKSLTSLKDLYVEDCPLIQSFPDQGLPFTLQHLQIIRCPLLIKKCQEEDIAHHVPDREVTSDPEKKKYSPFSCGSKGIRTAA